MTDIKTIFHQVVDDVYAVAEADSVPAGTTMTVDVGVELHRLQVTKTGGVLSIFKPKKTQRQSNLSIKLATRITVTKPE